MSCWGRDSWLSWLSLSKEPEQISKIHFVEHPHPPPPTIRVVKMPFPMGMHANGGEGEEKVGNFLPDFDPISFEFSSLDVRLATRTLRELALVVPGCQCNLHTWEEANQPWDPSSGGKLTRVVLDSETLVREERRRWETRRKQIPTHSDTGLGHSVVSVIITICSKQ